MNKFFKFAPVAVAAIALASCSNDDLFGSANGVVGESGPSIAVSVESQGETRAFATGTGMIDWTDGDVLRVYDSKVQKYDNFAWLTNKFVRVNDPEAQYVDPYVGATEEESAFALYAGGNTLDGDEQAVSYSGWKQTADGGVPVALVYVPKDLNYNESLQSTDASVVVYKSNMPMWGRLSAAATSGAEFKASLSWLTSYVRPRFENANKLLDPIKKVKVQAMKFADGLDATTIVAPAKAAAVADMKGQDITAYTFGTSGKKFAELFVADGSKHLNGWFDAELKTGGQLIDTDDEAIAQPAANRNVLEINVEGELIANQNYIWIPIISGVTYDVLAITFVTEGGNEYIAAVYFDYKAERAKGKAVGIEYPNTGYILDGTTTAKVTKGIKESYDGSANAVVIFNEAYEGAGPSQHMVVSSGAASKNTIYLPQITNKNLEIHIENDGTATTLDGADLTIADATGVTAQGTGVVTLVIDNLTAAAAQNVKINSKANIVLAGNYSNANITLAQGDNCANLTLGTAATAFNYGAKTLTATKGNLTVAKMNATGLVEFDNASGTLAVNSTLAKATVTKASSATIAGAVTTVEAKNNLTINAYNATDGVLTIGTLNIHKGVTAITLNGGIIDEIKSNATAPTAVVAEDNVTVTSSGPSAIRKNNYATGKIAFTSSFAVPAATSTEPKFVDAFDADETSGFIYTGAQLAAVDQATDVAGKAANQTAFALKTNITGLTNWQSPDLAVAFAGGKAAENGLTIAGVDGPLFGTVSANISNVDLTVAIDKDANNIGGLAKINGGDVNVENVKVAGTIAGTYNVGGIFGTTKATAANAINIGDEGTAAKKVEVTATFTNKTPYASPYNGRTERAGTFGKFIGQAAANTTVVIATECVATAAFNKKTLHFDYNRIPNAETGMNEWQFKGNTDYIGYSPAATTSLTYGGQAYVTGWATDATGVSYNATTKKVTGTVYTLDIYKGTYANLDATTKAAIVAVVGGAWDASYATAEAAGEVDWSGLVIKSHNSYEAFGAE